MKCPKCDGKLLQATVDEINVDQCIECSGIWFDFDELNQILQKDRAAILKNLESNNAGHDIIPAPCPHCGGNGNMIPVVDSIHGFRIDTCTVCYGKWLDGGEYEKLKRIDIIAFLKKIF